MHSLTRLVGLYFILIASTLFLIDCGKKEEPATIMIHPETKKFVLPEEFSATKHLIYSISGNSDKREDVLVILFDTTKNVVHQNRLIYYESDSSGAYSIKSSLVIEDLTSINVTDINNDNKQEVVASIDGGGSSETASRGVNVYTIENGQLTLAKAIPYGDPQLIQLDGKSAFMLHDRYSGFFSKSQSAVYVDSIVFLSNIPPQESQALTLKFFREIELQTSAELDTLLADDSLLKKNSKQYYQLVFDKIVNKVMLMKKANRNRESDEFLKSISKKIKFMPRSYRDIIDELRMES
jgi:hypothetical protein